MLLLLLSAVFLKEDLGAADSGIDNAPKGRKCLVPLIAWTITSIQSSRSCSLSHPKVITTAPSITWKEYFCEEADPNRVVVSASTALEGDCKSTYPRQMDGEWRDASLNDWKIECCLLVLVPSENNSLWSMMDTHTYNIQYIKSLMYTERLTPVSCTTPLNDAYTYTNIYNKTQGLHCEYITLNAVVALA